MKNLPQDIRRRRRFGERVSQPDGIETLEEWSKDEREREMIDFQKENTNILMLNPPEEFKNIQTIGVLEV